MKKLGRIIKIQPDHPNKDETATAPNQELSVNEEIELTEEEKKLIALMADVYVNFLINNKDQLSNAA